MIIMLMLMLRIIIIQINACVSIWNIFPSFSSVCNVLFAVANWARYIDASGNEMWNMHTMSSAYYTMSWPNHTLQNFAMHNAYYEHHHKKVSSLFLKMSTIALLTTWVALIVIRPRPPLSARRRNNREESTSRDRGSMLRRTRGFSAWWRTRRRGKLWTN